LRRLDAACDSSLTPNVPGASMNLGGHAWPTRRTIEEDAMTVMLANGLATL
jgi:hypothetical protein